MPSSAAGTRGRTSGTSTTSTAPSGAEPPSGRPTFSGPPEGCSLYAHTLSLTNSVPGALLARSAGFFAAYNALVVFAFTLAFVGLYRLARRLGAGPLSAAAGAAVFAFAPPHFARALGHLNLLGTGWIPLSLEALFVARARRAPGRLFVRDSVCA